MVLSVTVRAGGLPGENADPARHGDTVVDSSYIKGNME
jgi:hypothetical protein